MTTNESPISAQCGSCSNSFRVKSKAAGRTVKCPKCKKPVDIPADDPGFPDLDAAYNFELPAEPVEQHMPDINAPVPHIDVTPPAAPVERAPSPVAVQRGVTPPRAYPALGIVRILFRVFAGVALVGWLGMTGIGLFGLIVASSSTSERPPLPEGVSEDTPLTSPDLTDSQREALIRRISYVSPAKAGGVTFVALFIPWLAWTMSVAVSICVLIAAAELIQLAVDVQDNTWRSAQLTT